MQYYKLHVRVQVCNIQCIYMYIYILPVLYMYMYMYDIIIVHVYMYMTTCLVDLFLHDCIVYIHVHVFTCVHIQCMYSFCTLYTIQTCIMYMYFAFN